MVYSEKSWMISQTFYLRVSQVLRKMVQLCVADYPIFSMFKKFKDFIMSSILNWLNFQNLIENKFFGKHSNFSALRLFKFSFNAKNLLTTTKSISALYGSWTESFTLTVLPAERFSYINPRKFEIRIT